MATVEFCFKNTEYKFADLSGNQLPINQKSVIGIKITFISWNSHIPSFPALLFLLDLWNNGSLRPVIYLVLMLAG